MPRVIKRVIAFTPIFDSTFESRTGPLQVVALSQVRCLCSMSHQLGNLQSSDGPWLYNLSTSEAPAKVEDYAAAISGTHVRS